MQVMPRNLPVDAVLFDLDGTLLHTSPDIGRALNRALTERGIPPIAPDAAQGLIGGGSAVLVQRALSLLGRDDEAHTIARFCAAMNWRTRAFARVLTAI